MAQRQMHTTHRHIRIIIIKKPSTNFKTYDSIYGYSIPRSIAQHHYQDKSIQCAHLPYKSSAENLWHLFTQTLFMCIQFNGIFVVAFIRLCVCVSAHRFFTVCYTFQRNDPINFANGSKYGPTISHIKLHRF